MKILWIAFLIPLFSACYFDNGELMIRSGKYVSSTVTGKPYSRADVVLAVQYNDYWNKHEDELRAGDFPSFFVYCDAIEAKHSHSVVRAMMDIRIKIRESKERAQAEIMKNKLPPVRSLAKD